MWECLVSFSTWVEDNSGQIQIGIGLFAIWYAKQGYNKIKEQINHAYMQEQQLKEQKSFDLKIQSVNLLLDAVDKNKRSLQSLHIILNDYEPLLSSIENKESLSVKEGLRYVDKLKNIIQKLEIIQESLYSKCNEINTGEYSDWKSISLIYTGLIEATKIADKYETLVIKMQDNSTE